MIVDSSALLAVLLRESESTRFEEAIAKAPSCRISVANALEAYIVVVSRGGTEAGEELDSFLDTAQIELSPVTEEQLTNARRAWLRFGKGFHPAALNFGDCFAYALAESTGEPLLFKGDDFSRTEIESAMDAGDSASS